MNAATMEFRQIFDNGQAEAEATLFACGRGIGLTKAIEDATSPRFKRATLRGTCQLVLESSTKSPD